MGGAFDGKVAKGLLTSSIKESADLFAGLIKRAVVPLLLQLDGSPRLLARLVCRDSGSS